MTENAIKPYQAAGAATTRFENGALLPNSFEGLWRIAQVMASSRMMPKGLDSVEAVFVAVQAGLEIGLTPMAAVQNIAVINNRPTLWGDAVLALVLGSSLCEDFNEWLEGDGESLVAWAEAKRKGKPKAVKRSFSWAEAKQADLLSKPGPWKQYPRRMLQLRARGFCLRDAFPDILKGLRMAEEEIDAIDMERSAGGSYSVAQKSVERMEAVKARLSAAREPEQAEEIREAIEEQGADVIQADEAPQADPGNGSPWDAFRKEWINIKRAGFKAYVTGNLKRFLDAPLEIQQVAFTKWGSLYPGEAWPVLRDGVETPGVTPGPTTVEDIPAIIEDASPTPAEPVQEAEKPAPAGNGIPGGGVAAQTGMPFPGGVPNGGIPGGGIPGGVPSGRTSPGVPLTFTSEYKALMETKRNFPDEYQAAMRSFGRRPNTADECFQVDQAVTRLLMLKEQAGAAPGGGDDDEAGRF